MDTKYMVPTATINERPDGYDIRFVIPGVGKGEVDLDVQGRTLVLKTRSSRQNPAGFRQVAAEFECGPYAVSVDLPEMADPSTLKASLENGILRIELPKADEANVRHIAISEG